MHAHPDGDLVEERSGFVSFIEIAEFYSRQSNGWSVHDVLERLRSKAADGFFTSGDGVRVFGVPGHSGTLEVALARQIRGFVDCDQQDAPSVERHLLNRCYLSNADFLRWCGELALQPIPSRARPAATASAFVRRGRKSKWDWPGIELFVDQLMSERGPFIEWDAGSNWQCQADLERQVVTYITDRLHQEAPSESRLRDRVSAMLARWTAKSSNLSSR